MATGSLTQKDEFKNTSAGWIGVTLIDGRGDHKGFPVAPGDSVWLSEEEQIATANAPRADTDNPFLPREHTVFDETGGEVGKESHPTLELVTAGADVRNRRPFGAVANPVELAVEPVVPAVVPDEEITGATAVPDPDTEPAIVGSEAPGEEVATPAARRRKRPTTAS
jgi:hypothetical protein